MKKAKIGVFIINYNGASKLGDLLFKCINSVIRQKANGIDIDVWFVDNGSTDGSLNIVKTKYKDAMNYLKLSRNLGYGIACNIAYYVGSKYHNYDYVMFMNNDVVLFEDAVSQLLKALNTLSLSTNDFLATMLFLNGYDGRLDFGSFFIDDTCGSWPLRIAVESPDTVKELARTNSLVKVHYIDGAFMLFPSRVFGRLKGFDHKLFLYGEDVEISLRAKYYGIDLVLIPIIGGVHYRSMTTRSTSTWSLYYSIRNRVYNVLKYMGVVSFIKLWFWYLFYPFRLHEAKLYKIMVYQYWIPESNFNKVSHLMSLVLRAFINGIRLWKQSRKRIPVLAKHNVFKLTAKEILSLKVLIKKKRKEIIEALIRDLD